MGMVYLLTAWFEIEFEKFIPLALLSLATISGFASLGYLLNDFFDREKDARAGKKNFLAGKSPLLVILFFLISISFLLLPWKFLPFDNFSAALIISQVLLFLIYSIPPVRLKERGLAGIITDALYAHSLPVVLAAYTFSLAAERAFPVFPVILLFAWQTLTGVRNILIHQADDLRSDKKSGEKNFVPEIYPKPFHSIVKYLIFSELLFSLVFFGMLTFSQPLFLICMVAIFIVSALVALFHEKGVEQLLKGGWKFFPNNLFEKWLPPSVLIALSVIDNRFIAILLLHLALFNFDFYTQMAMRVALPLVYLVKDVVLRVIALFRIASAALLNHSIYYCFLIFGVDLKKENSSALDYLRKLRNKSDG